jgi:hypothetical protein
MSVLSDRGKGARHATTRHVAQDMETTLENFKFRGQRALGDDGVALFTLALNPSRKANGTRKANNTAGVVAKATPNVPTTITTIQHRASQRSLASGDTPACRRT